MSKHKISELTGLLLDRAVAAIDGTPTRMDDSGVWRAYDNPCGWPGACPGWWRLDGLFGKNDEDLRNMVREKFGEYVELPEPAHDGL